MRRSLLQLKNFFRNNWLGCVGIFLFFSCYYAAVILLRIDTDVQPHAFVAYRFAQQPGAITPNFLFFIIVALLAGFSKYKALYYAAAVVVIAGSLTVKYFANRFYIKNPTLAQYLRAFTAINSGVIQPQLQRGIA